MGIEYVTHIGSDVLAIFFLSRVCPAVLASALSGCNFGLRALYRRGCVIIYLCLFVLPDIDL